MKTHIAAAGIAAFMLAVFPWNAFADVVWGEVDDIRQDANQVTILKIDPDTGKHGNQKTQVQLSEMTRLENFDSLSELRKGDEVKVGGAQDEQTGTWKADTLALAKFQIMTS